MGKTKADFKTALLTLVQLQDAERKAAIEAGEAQRRQQEAYAATTGPKDAVMVIWKKTRDGQFGIASYYRLPDGRVAVVQSHCVTVWNLIDLT